MTQNADMAVFNLNMLKNKVCILAAGRGTRLGEYTQVLNKAMLPLGGKAIISHIFGNFPAGTSFVVATGYKGEELRSYIELAHAELDVTFVNVPDYDGPESGPGASLLTCRHAIGEVPFYFVTCDTYWKTSVEGMPTDRSWFALDWIEQSKTHHYMTVDLDGSRITELHFKERSTEAKKETFTGLAFVKDISIFWSSLEKTQLILGEKQVTEPFHELARQGKLYSTFIDWVDTGLLENYQSELKKYGQYDFSKVKEALYCFSGRVIKYFDNDLDSKQRVQRAKLNPSVFPKITGDRKHMYCYEYQPGNTLYEDDRPEVFRKLLTWLDRKLWLPVSVDKSIVQKRCDEFYREKTLARIDQFKKKYPGYNVQIINDESIPSTEALLENLSWKIFEDGLPFFIHGDLQPDNIIYDGAQDRFVLLDWRQNFAGELNFGDLYYDFAKLWGGLNLSYKEIKNNSFSYEESGLKCNYRYPQHKHFTELSAELEKLAVSKNLSVAKIRMMVGIIYLNMSPLHHYPFDKMLYALGRKVLFEAQNHLS